MEKNEKSIQLLSKLISYPTVSSEPLEDMAAFLAQHAEDQGFKVLRFETEPGKINLVAHLGPMEHSGLALSGHMDVVPVVGQKWDSDPFSMKIDGEWMIGRGSCDMKGFIATTHAVMEKMDLKNPRKGLSLIWTHDEEVGCLGARALKTQFHDCGLQAPEAILIGEPTDMNICRMHGGHTTVELKIKGQSAHSSKPHLGANAIDCAAQMIGEIREIQSFLAMSPCPHHEMHGAHSLINVAEIKGGQAVNIIPENCSLRLGLRTMPGQDTDDILSLIRERIEDFNLKQNCEIQLHIPQNSPPLLTRANTILETQLRKLLPEASSIGVPFATDGGWFSKMGSEPIICGPGSIDVAHKPNERISMNSIRHCEEMLSMLIHNWRLS